MCIKSSNRWLIGRLQYLQYAINWASSTGGLVRNYFSVRTILNSTGSCKVRTVASPVERSVNKSRDTRNCVQNEPDYAICVIFTNRPYYKALGLILCDQSWQICHHWTSLTGLTAVSEFKPHLPAQWTVGTHHKGPSRIEKVTSRMNWPIKNSPQIRNWN